MNTEATLHQALHRDPGDRTCWLALADWLEESGQPQRAELLRLRLGLQSAEAPHRDARERRLRALLEAGVEPAGPVLVNSVGMRLTLIPPGSFWMGSPEGEPGRHLDEDPRHHVVLT